MSAYCVPGFLVTSSRTDSLPVWGGSVLHSAGQKAEAQNGGGTPVLSPVGWWDPKVSPEITSPGGCALLSASVLAAVWAPAVLEREDIDWGPDGPHISGLHLEFPEPWSAGADETGSGLFRRLVVTEVPPCWPGCRPVPCFCFLAQKIP